MEDVTISRTLLRNSDPFDKNKKILVSSFNDAIRIVKPNGKYQKFSVIFLFIAYTCTGAFLNNGFSYLERDPQIYCYTPELGRHLCNRKEACGDDPSLEPEFKFINETYSWVNDFKMECDKNHLISYFGSGYFLGTLISTFFVGIAADYFGRSLLIKISMTIRTLLIIIPFVYQNPQGVIVFLFLSGFFHVFHSTVPYILVSEIISERHLDSYMTYMFVSESFVSILTILIFYFNQNWKYFLIFNGIYGGLYFVFGFSFVLESPKYLHATQKYKETRNVLEKISKINTGKMISIVFPEEFFSGTSNKIKKHQKFKEFRKKEDRIKFKDLFRFYPREIFILPIIWLINAFAFRIIHFMIKYLNAGDLTILNIVLFVSDIISYFISIILLKKLNKILLMVIFFFLSGIAFIILPLFNLDDTKNKIYLYFFTFLIKFGSCIVLNVSAIYSSEAFPSETRGRAIGICSFFGKLGSMFAPYYNEYQSNISIMSGITCFIAAFLSIFLPNKSEKRY